MFFCSKKGQFTYLAKMRFAKIRLACLFFMLWGISLSVEAQSLPPSQYKDSPTDVELPTEEQLFKDDPDPVVLSAQIAVRLKKIQQTIPLDYNEHVQKYISYNTNEKRKTHLAKMLGRSKKFFPIFEPILAKYGIPDEMKYLAVVESALNPFAVSKMGATGPWQFMYSTALRYDLTISKRIDERRDPYAACEAAAKYLKEMYNLYGNWHLAIASYNCGAGNVNKAIKKAGGSTSFWDIHMYLPAETRAYVPSFIAVVYAMKYAGKYGISPQIIDRENMQRVTVRQKITVNDLETMLEIPRQLLVEENPSLLTTFIPPDYILNLPVSKITAFHQFQDSLYQKAICEIEEQQLISPNAVSPKITAKENKVVKEVKEVKEDKIATAPVKEIKKTTNAKSDENWKSIPVVSDEKTTPKNTTVSKKPTAVVLKEDNVNYKTIAYTVKPGDNLGYIASWFHCNVKEIRRWNNLSGNYIDVKDELLIYIHKNDYKKFVRFNYLSTNIKNELSAKITTQEETEEKTKAKEIKEQTPLIDKINPVKIMSKKDCFQTYKIKDGETLWSIAQKYDEVTVQDLMSWNGFKKTPVLHKGDEIKVRKIACK